MALLDLNNLAGKIDELLQAFQSLRQENRLLREQLAQLALERQALLEKKINAAGQIKQIINQLREEMHERIL